MWKTLGSKVIWFGPGHTNIMPELEPRSPARMLNSPWWIAASVMCPHCYHTWNNDPIHKAKDYTSGALSSKSCKLHWIRHKATENPHHLSKPQYLICQAWICNLQWGCTDHNNCRSSGHWKKCYKVQKQHWVMLVVVVWAILENLAMTLIPATCYLAKSLNLWASRSSCEHMINNLCPASLRKWSELNENTGKHLQIAKHWYQFKVLWLNPSSLLNWNKTVT